MSDTPLLDQIDSPAELRRLDPRQLQQLLLHGPRLVVIRIDHRQGGVDAGDRHLGVERRVDHAQEAPDVGHLGRRHADGTKHSGGRIVESR